MIITVLHFLVYHKIHYSFYLPLPSLISAPMLWHCLCTWRVPTLLGGSVTMASPCSKIATSHWTLRAGTKLMTWRTLLADSLSGNHGNESLSCTVSVCVCVGVCRIPIVTSLIKSVLSNRYKLSQLCSLCADTLIVFTEQIVLILLYAGSLLLI